MDEPIVAGQPAVVPGPAQPSPTDQQLIAGKFKSQDELVKGYQEVEKKMTQVAQEKATLERQLQEEIKMREQFIGRTAQPAAPQEAAVNYDELFWLKPTEVIGRVVERFLSPFEEDRYQMQKVKYANDPDFKRYEQQIDQMIALQPDLKRQPGAIDKMYKVLKAFDFDPATVEQQIRQKIIAESQGRIVGAVEGASPPPPGTPQSISLTTDEMRIAEKYYPELNQQEAYKKYAESKVKWEAGR